MSEMFQGIDKVKDCPECGGRMVRAIFTIMPVHLCTDTDCHLINGFLAEAAYKLAELFTFLGADALVFTAYNKGKYFASLPMALFKSAEE